MTAPTKEAEFGYAFTLLANAQECLRQAQEALTKGSAGGAIGSLEQAQRALTTLLMTSGRLVGRGQGTWPA